MRNLWKVEVVEGGKVKEWKEREREREREK